MTEAELAARIAVGYEQAGIEFKSAASTKDKWIFAKIVRACLAMANRRDGGYVVIGVKEGADKSLEPEGLTAEQVTTWRDYDAVVHKINSYAQPSIELDIFARVVDGKLIVVVQVHEFELVPVLCSAQFDYINDRTGKPETILRRGACYVRSRQKPETAEIPGEQEMRTLLDLATSKAVERRIREIRDLGLIPRFAAEPIQESDERRYEKELEGVR